MDTTLLNVGTMIRPRKVRTMYTTNLAQDIYDSESEHVVLMSVVNDIQDEGNDCLKVEDRCCRNRRYVLVPDKADQEDTRGSCT